MPRPPSTTPTEGELAILQVIWRQGPMTLREVHEAIGTKVTRASVFRRLEILVGKGLLERDSRSKGEGGSRYSPVQTKNSVITGMFRRMVDLFGGSTRALFHGLLKDGELSEREFNELKSLANEERSAEPEAAKAARRKGPRGGRRRRKADE